jgi:hypothetical protein
LKLFQESREGDKGERWRKGIQLGYIIRAFVNVTMYLQDNNNTK